VEESIHIVRILANGAAPEVGAGVFDSPISIAAARARVVAQTEHLLIVYHALRGLAQALGVGVANGFTTPPSGCSPTPY
jgi:hypothetical protein